MLGDDEPGRAARAAEQLDRLDVDAGVPAEAALVDRYAHREQAGVGELRDMGGIDPAGRVVGRGGVRGEHLGGEPGDGADGRVPGDLGRWREEGLDGGRRT